MNWYLAKLVFRIYTNKEDVQVAQFDEQLRMLQGNSEGEALMKAKTIGKTEETEFSNSAKGKVKWLFVDVSQLSEIKGLSDGMEIFSRTEEVEEPDGYLHTVKRMADSISKRVNTQAILKN